jgi:hypothetical protein
LISRGHRWVDITRRYTYDQFYAFYEAAVKNERRQYIDSVYAMRAAYHAEGKEFKKFIKDQSKVFNEDKRKQRQNTGGAPSGVPQDAKKFSSLHVLRGMLSGK